MNYIFLDIDGVLNNKNHYHKMHKKYGGRFFMENMPFNPRSLKNLRKIIDRTGGKENTKIVLTSSWRKSDRGMIILKARLIEYGIKIQDDYITPDIDGCRGKEIYQWLKNHYSNISKENNFIIIDDESYDINTYFTKEHIVHCNWFKGLTWLKTLESINKLNNIMYI